MFIILEQYMAYVMFPKQGISLKCSSLIIFELTINSSELDSSVTISASRSANLGIIGAEDELFIFHHTHIIRQHHKELGLLKKK